MVTRAHEHSSARAWAERFQQRPAEREIITPDPGHSVRWVQHDYPTELARWNYHPEIEIHLIRKGIGRFITGDYVGTFTAGQVTIIGAELPHDWVSALQPGEHLVNRDALVQFDPAWLLSCMDGMPELAQARDLLDESARGIEFLGHTRAAAAEQIEAMGATTGISRLGHLVTLLALLSTAPAEEKRLLAREWFQRPTDAISRLAVEEGLDYIFKNLHGRISLSEAANRAHMTDSTFSRYFKRASGHTFSTVVRRLRISHARILLEQTDTAIADICYEVGFTNLSNFNRQFLAEVGSTPRQYRRTVRDSLPRPDTLPLGEEGTATG